LDSLESDTAQRRAILNTATSLRVLWTSNRFRDNHLLKTSSVATKTRTFYCNLLRVTHTTAAFAPCSHAQNSIWTLYIVCSQVNSPVALFQAKKYLRALRRESRIGQEITVASPVNPLLSLTVCSRTGILSSEGSVPWHYIYSFIYVSINDAFKAT
jgi:hypothetical protein